MFILIHGAYHGGWCWAPVIGALAEKSHKAVAPDLPGHGSDPAWLSDQTFPNYVARIDAAIRSAEGPVTLVGHSMGGAIAAQVAEQTAENVARIIFLAAYIPVDGETIADVVRTDPDSHMQVLRADIGGTDAVMPRDGIVADVFYNDATPDQLSMAEDRVQPQSVTPFMTPLHLTDRAFGTVAKSAVICAHDRAISPAHQRRMAERAGCTDIRELETGHSPFITQPAALADLLVTMTEGPAS